MRFYQAFDADEETPVQFAAVHVIRWRSEWGEPTILFREVDDETQTLADAAPGLLAACKSILIFLTGDEYHEFYYQAEIRQLRAAIAKARPDADD